MEEYDDFSIKFDLEQEIHIEQIGGVPYFVIPMHSPMPSLIKPFQEQGKDYREDYFQALEQHHRLAKELNDLMGQSEKLQKAIKEEKNKGKQRKREPVAVKRERRLAKEIPRHFKCHFCSKSYGSEGSLKQHVKYKHETTFSL